MMNFYTSTRKVLFSGLFVLAAIPFASGAEEKNVTLTEAGTLADFISPEEKYTITDLTVAGPINGDDIILIRDMAGRGTYSGPTDGKLEKLNLQNARIVEGGESYIYYDNYTEKDIIGRSMFDQCDQLKHIVLPDNVTAIMNSAFYRCSGLEEMILPETLTAIYSNAFFYATSLPSIKIPKNLEHLDEAVFCGCASMKEITADTDNATFSSVDGVLYNKDADKLLVFPGGRTGEFTIPSGVTEIAPAAFNESLISSVIVPEGVVKIGDAAFSNSYELESVSLPNSLKEIEFDTFYWCEKLKDLKFPEELEAIGSRAFVHCEALTSIALPSTVKIVEDRAFANCTNLESITLSQALEEFGIDVFISDKKLTAINVPAECPNFKSVDGVLLNGDATLLIKCPEGKSGAFYVPESVKSIEDEAFYNCAEITAIEMADNVEDIGLSAFSGCYSIKKVRLSEKLQKIASYLFESCSDMTEVYLGANISEIGEFAFSSCSSLGSIVFPASLKTIESDAFSYCSGLSEITAEGEVPPTCTTEYTFYGLDTSKIRLNVPESALEAYKADSTWSKFDLLGVSGVEQTAIASSRVNIYDMQGRILQQGIDPSEINVPGGIYIVKDLSSGSTRKAMIKK